MKRNCLIVLALFIGATWSLLQPNLPAHASASGWQFKQTTTAANTYGNYTIINNSVTNGNPSIPIHVTHNWGSSGGVYDAHPVGVWYTGSNWAIFNEDMAALPLGVVFNVYVTFNYAPGNGLNVEDVVDTTTTGNTVGSITYLSDALANSNPAAALWVTPNYNPDGACGCVYNPHPIGVFYDTAQGRWAIFNEDIGAMPLGTSFNVEVWSNFNGSAFIQTATSSNSFSDYTLINNPYTNGNPSALLFVTQNWGTGVSNKHTIGVFYSTYYGKWAIYNEDLTAVPSGASFNVMVNPGIPA